VRAAEAARGALARRARDGAQGLEPEAVAAALAAELHADGARVLFWDAVAWGGWSQSHGLLGAVREGVAGRLESGARAAAALDPGLERGGAFRLLARLHATLPRIPLLSGWVDRSKALPFAERALAIDPAFAGNRLLHALTLLDVAPARRAEALAELRAVAASEPDPGQEDRVERLAIRRGARERLAEEEGAPAPAD
jgi:hypothetical protein